MDYRRFYQPGGRYFFTVTTYQRTPILKDRAQIDRLRKSFSRVRSKRPFEIDAIVILPDHLHTVWQLPEGDADYSTRWSMIKHDFSIALHGTPVNSSRRSRREKGIWQRRFWEHVIRDDMDWKRHMDYVHFNPVKHGYALSPADWPYSTFKQAVQKGWYPNDWGRYEPESTSGLWLE